MSAAAKSVLWVLADAAHHPSDPEMPCGCWLLLETIATRACISVAKVKRGLAELRDRQLMVSRLTGRGLNIWLKVSYQTAHSELPDSSLRAPEASVSVYQTSEAAAVGHCEPPAQLPAHSEPASGARGRTERLGAPEAALAGTVMSRTVHAASKPYAQRSEAAVPKTAAEKIVAAPSTLVWRPSQRPMLSPADEAERERIRVQDTQQRRLQVEVIHQLTAGGRTAAQVAESMSGVTLEQIENIARSVGIQTAPVAFMTTAGGSIQ
jgi:hypothetical protein